MNIGIYAGTFDPITRGHVNVIERAFRFCDTLIVVIGINKAKKTLFDLDTRLGFIHSSTRDVQGSIVIDCTEKLITDYAKSQEARLLIRGVRSSKDFEYETTLAQINKDLAPGIETILLPALPKFQNVSSSMVKELASFNVDIRDYVESEVSLAFGQFAFDNL